MRKTKIICTIGPACENETILKSMVYAGMDVARFNFSHGNHEEQLNRLKMIRKLCEEENLYIPCMLDTKGPEIRTGILKNGKSVELKKGDTFILTTEVVEGDEKEVSITFEDLPMDVSAGNRILIDDGLIGLDVVNTTEKDIVCKVAYGGILGQRKGVNIPGVNISMPYISEKDRADIIFGIENEFDFIAASFTRSAADILDIKKILKEYNGTKIRIIAKIENGDGVADIDDILRISDGIMIARGDMGVEIPLEDVPVLQKQLINKAYKAGKIVITATQMLESMISHPRPTRAETSDVANAIFDGTSAIMLSGETAVGKYPVETVETMARIAVRTEDVIDYRARMHKDEVLVSGDVTNAISHAACTTAYDLHAAAILAITLTGFSARNVSKYRPDIPIIGCSPDPAVLRQMNMSWGVTPLELDRQTLADDLFTSAVKNAQEQHLLKNGDLVVITAGVPLGIAGTTNMLRVHIVGDVLVKGTGVNALSTVGNLCVATSVAEAVEHFKEGDILVIHETTNEILDLLKRASGIVTEVGDQKSHAAIVGLSLDIPVIVNASSAVNILKSGTMVNVDAEKGLVCILRNEDK